MAHENEVSGSNIATALFVMAFRKVPSDIVERDASRSDQVGEAARIVLRERAEQDGGS